MLRADLRRVDVAADLSLEYTERGTGPAVVFLHGYGDSCHAFDGVVAGHVPHWEQPKRFVDDLLRVLHA